jgi:hypothetical protein
MKKNLKRKVKRPSPKTQTPQSNLALGKYTLIQKLSKTSSINKINEKKPPMKKPHGLNHRALFIYTATTYSPTNLWQYHQR